MYQKCLSGMEWPDALSALPYIVFRSGGVRAELCGEGVAGNAGSAQTRLSRIRGMGIVLQYDPDECRVYSCTPIPGRWRSCIRQIRRSR